MPGIDSTSKKKKRRQEEARLANTAALSAAEDELRANSKAWREQKDEDVTRAERVLLHHKYNQKQQRVTYLKSIASEAVCAAAEARSDDSDASDDSDESDVLEEVVNGTDGDLIADDGLVQQQVCMS